MRLGHRGAAGAAWTAVSECTRVVRCEAEFLRYIAAMGIAEWLSAIALLGIPVSVWATRRYGSRRARLIFEYSSVPLLPDADPHGLLEVTYRDFPVKDAHLVSASLTNSGSRDITSAMFDASRPLVLSVEGMFYGATVVAGPQVILPAIGSTGAAVRFGPALLKRGERWSISAVVSGGGSVVLDSPLIDTDVEQREPSVGREVKVRVDTLAGAVETRFRLGGARGR